MRCRSWPEPLPAVTVIGERPREGVQLCSVAACVCGRVDGFEAHAMALVISGGGDGGGVVA